MLRPVFPTLLVFGLTLLPAFPGWPAETASTSRETAPKRFRQRQQALQEAMTGIPLPGEISIQSNSASIPAIISDSSTLAEDLAERVQADRQQFQERFQEKGEWEKHQQATRRNYDKSGIRRIFQLRHRVPEAEKYLRGWQRQVLDATGASITPRGIDDDSAGETIRAIGKPWSAEGKWTGPKGNSLSSGKDSPNPDRNATAIPPENPSESNDSETPSSTSASR
jgi:hypothetical protein